MPKPQCNFIKKDGTHCRMAPISGDKFCISHTADPIAIAKKTDGSRRGGRANAKPDSIASWEGDAIESMQDLRYMLSELAKAGMRGTVSTARLSALAAVANSLSKVIEGSDLENRIKALEEQTAKGGRA